MATDCVRTKEDKRNINSIETKQHSTFSIELKFLEILPFLAGSQLRHNIFLDVTGLANILLATPRNQQLMAKTRFQVLQTVGCFSFKG